MPAASAYDEGYYEDREGTLDFRIERRQLLRLLGEGAGLRLLEVGCGAGAMLAAAAGRGYRVAGLDGNDVALAAAARTAPGAELVNADASRLPFDDGSFDRVLAHHLIEHLGDAEAALAEWRRVLRPGGRVVICTPNRLYPCHALFSDPTHRRIFSPGELDEALRGAGFTSDELFTIFPHLWKGKVSVRVGVPLYRFFRRLPGYRDRGRSLFAAATRT